MDIEKILERMSQQTVFKPELKLKYIKTRTDLADSTLFNMLEVFHGFEKFEKKYEKDICEFNEKEIVTAFRKYRLYVGFYCRLNSYRLRLQTNLRKTLDGTNNFCAFTFHSPSKLT